MKIPFSSRRKRGVAGIIGAVILFTLLFTIGTQYFIFVNNANNLATQSLVNRANTLATRLQENAFVTTSLAAGNFVQFFLNNTGGLTLNMTAMILLSSSGSVLGCYGIGLPSGQGCTNTTPNLPQVANIGKGAPTSGYLVTNYVYTSGTVTLKLITSNGNIFSATYPPSQTSLAALALTSGAIGDVYLKPQSFTYFLLCTAASGPCTPCPTNGLGHLTATCYMQNQGLGISIPATVAGANQLAFSLTVVDYNPSRLTITLDQYTLLTNFFAPVGSSSSTKNVGWFIVSNTTNTLNDPYSQVTLSYGIPKTIVFASASSGFSSPFTISPAVAPSAGTIALIFILTHGCKAVVGICNFATATYSQNSPYITTLYD